MDLFAGLSATGALNFILSSAILACYLWIVAMLAFRPLWFPVFALSLAVNIPLIGCFLVGAHWVWGSWYPPLVCAVQMAAVLESVMRVTLLLRCSKERSDARQGAFILAGMFLCVYGACAGRSYPAPTAPLRTLTDFAAAGALLGILGYVWSERCKAESQEIAHSIILFTYFLAGAFADSDSDPKDFFAVNAMLSFARLGCAALWISLVSALPGRAAVSSAAQNAQ